VAKLGSSDNFASLSSGQNEKSGQTRQFRHLQNAHRRWFAKKL